MVPDKPTLSGGSTRRRFLRTGAATLVTGLAASTTGCLSGLPPLGEKQAYGRLDVPRADDPDYRRWLPEPASVDGEHYTFLYAQPASIDGSEPEEFLFRQAATKRELDYFGIGYRQFDTLLDVAHGTVIEAEFDPTTVAETLTESGYERDGTYRDYELFSRSDVPRRTAVGDGTIVWSSRRVHDTPDVEALIDARSGEGARYHDASDSFARLSDAIGASRLIIGGPEFGDPTDRAELGADGFRFTEDAVYQVVKLLFPDGDVPTTDALEKAVREAHWMSDEADVFDVQVDGRLAAVETRIPRSQPADQIDSVEHDPPQITWGASYDPETESLTIRHEAGEAVDSELLWYDVDTEESPGEVEKRPLWETTARVGPGDSTTISLEEYTRPTDVSVVLSENRGCCGIRSLFDYKLAWGRGDE